MKVSPTDLPGVLLIEPKVFGDNRGFFLETFRVDRYAELADIRANFVQDNHSRSRRGVLRGMHLQKRHPQGKLVRVARGEVFDVVADIDPRSTSFRKWIGVNLSDENGRQIWIPPGYAHGFLTLSEIVDFEYKCTDFYDPASEGGVIWNDPELAIAWPMTNPAVSAKDAKLPTLAELRRGS